MIPDIAYMILNYNPDGEEIAQEVLYTTIDSFYSRRSKNLSCEVCLLDQGTTTDHRDWILEMGKIYRFSSILLKDNIGISGAINLLVRNSKAPVLGLITSDVVITSGMDEDLYSKIQIPEVYQVTPFTDKSDLEYQTWKPKEEYGSDHIDLSGLKSKAGFRRHWFGKTGHEPYLRCVGSELTIMFWRRDVFQEIGYFDERWKACYENIDFGLRCFLNGGCTAISRDSFVWHYHKVTEKNGSREKVYGVDNWQKHIKCMWDEKWPDLDSYFDIYKPLGNRTVKEYPQMLERFKGNIYHSYDNPSIRFEVPLGDGLS
jgi:GT2 family glycosyltransferase